MRDTRWGNGENWYITHKEPRIWSSEIMDSSMNGSEGGCLGMESSDGYEFHVNSFSKRFISNELFISLIMGIITVGH